MFREMMARSGTWGAVVAVGLLFAAALTPAAWGAFPGRDGRIAFTTDVGAKETITTMEPDGSDVRYLTSAGTHASSPSWSADGKRIVFQRAGPGYPDIYVMRANGSGVRRLTSDPHWWDVDPSFSPGGRRIVFYRLFQGPNPRPGQIIIMRLRDLRMRVLTTDGIHPQWSPNGRRIAFTDETLDTGEDIATIRPDGSHERRLTDAADSPLTATTARPTPPTGTRSTLNATPWHAATAPP